MITNVVQLMVSIADISVLRSGFSPPSAAFGQTLQFITSIKLEELEKQRLAYEAHSLVLQRVSQIKDDHVHKVEMLLDAVRSWSGSGALDASSAVGAKLDLHNLELWLLQAKKDPSFSTDVLKGWADTLEAHIRHSLTRFECAKLFGKLFNEWLASGDSATAVNLTESPVFSPTTTMDLDREVFVEVGRKEMHEQKERLKSIIFEPKPVDTGVLLTYLADLFSSEDAVKSLINIRTNIRNFGDSLLYKTITVQDVSWAIANLLASELMDESKRTTLREFTENPTVLDEVASVLNMRLSSLSSWSWPEAGLEMEMRRHLNGKYRAFTNPEILDALFLQYIGVSWQCEFKRAFKDIFTSKGWKAAFEPLSKDEIDRRKMYLGPITYGAGGIESERQRMRQDHFLVSQLPTIVDSNPTYDDSANTTEENDSRNAVSASAIKQKLLHMMITECYLNETLHGRHTAVRTDLEWFGPSLPHDSIVTLLAFFGVPENWLDFFKTFLKAPMRFKDDPAGEFRVRERGTPISFALSALCGEVILFGMDFAVNQKADGLFLYRIHDDIWFWDSSMEKCIAAWQEMNTYASLVGIKFNAGKTGSACVGDELSPELPEGDIRWGFLKFDSSQSRFVIDRTDVDAHIVELRRQLSATKSVFGWINAYNKYMAFFVRNFGGRPAKCFGRVHVDEMIDTLAKIQRELFAYDEAEGGAIGHLRSMIQARFGVDNLPQGYFYFPISSGGLELRNPMIELFAMRDNIAPDPDTTFEIQVAKDYETYRTLKDAWDASGNSYRYLSSDKHFFPFTEYVRHRECHMSSWRWLYIVLLEVDKPIDVSLSPAVEAALKKAWPRDDKRWHYAMDFYQKWVVSLYADEVVERFGSLEVVDPTLIPVGMVQLFRNSRMRWDQ